MTKYENRDTKLDAARVLTPDGHRQVQALAVRVIQTLNAYIRSTQARQKLASDEDS